MKFTGWRRRFYAKLNALEELAAFMSRQKGEEDYAQGIMDTLEHMELILARLEKDNDPWFDPEGLKSPALMERAKKYLDKVSDDIKLQIDGNEGDGNAHDTNNKL
jgi:hypothetical protein